jgi:proteic killer suppression protein
MACDGDRLAVKTFALKAYRLTYHVLRYSVKVEVIRSFKNTEAEALFSGRFSRRLQQVARVAQRKLQQLHAARDLRDLAAFPGNRLEALAGDRRGQHSIRVNDRYRICFVWRDRDADDVEIVDYH